MSVLRRMTLGGLGHDHGGVLLFHNHLDDRFRRRGSKSSEAGGPIQADCRLHVHAVRNGDAVDVLHAGPGPDGRQVPDARSEVWFADALQEEEFRRR